MSKEYTEKFKVTCEICKKKFRVINALHLKTHGISVSEYRELYPDAPLSQVVCEECGTIITNSRSSKQRFCRECFVERERNRLREHMGRKWRQEHRNLSEKDREIIGNHHMTGLGTGAPTTYLDEIEVDGVMRIKGAAWLERWRKEHGLKNNFRARTQEIEDTGT